MLIRQGLPADHGRILAVMTDWWGGRDLTGLLLMVFFKYFSDTVFIAERDGELAGFLIGFMEQNNTEAGYIHLVGVAPEVRKLGLARALYERFFETCRRQNRYIVHSCTGFVNKASIAFHQRLGFEVLPGDDVLDGVPVSYNYYRSGDTMVLFKKVLD